MDKNYRALELDKILEMVAKEATCPDAAELARAIQPVYTAAEARHLLEETDAAFVLMAKFGAPSFYGLQNVTNAPPPAWACRSCWPWGPPCGPSAP